MSRYDHGYHGGTVLYWNRGDERIPVYFKGRWARDCEDGRRGDVRARPVHLGQGPFTVTYAADCMELEDGTPAFA
jgi:hypothetical protein